MGRIIPLRDARHERLRLLLPWYVTGRLDTAEHAAVEAHLADCAECRADARVERKLEAEVSGLSMDAERGWAELRRRALEPASVHAGVPSSRPARQHWWMAVPVAATLAMAAVLVPRETQPDYQTLGAAEAAAAAGDILVVFRPDAREADLRRALIAGNARLVDGPTAGGAYVLAVPEASRAAALAGLRRDAGVVMAEPLGGDAAR